MEGHELAYRRFAMKPYKYVPAESPQPDRTTPLTIDEANEILKISGANGLQIEFNKRNGTIEQYRIEDIVLIDQPVQLQFWRAIVDNERVLSTNPGIQRLERSP